MAKIPGPVYFIIGLLVSGVSWYVNTKQGRNDLELFFWIGLIFIAWGVFKIMIRLILSSGKKDKVPHTNANYHYRDIDHGRYCPACGTPISRFDMYCRGCGMRVR